MSIKCKEGATVVGTFSSQASFDASPFAQKWGLDYSLLGYNGHLLVLNISQKSELFIGYLDGDAEKLGVAVDNKLAKHASLCAEPGSEYSLAIDRRVLTGISMDYFRKHFDMSREELERRLRAIKVDVAHQTSLRVHGEPRACCLAHTTANESPYFDRCGRRR